MTTSSDKKTFADFNALTITGRVSFAELVDGQYGEFLSMTVLSDLINDGEAISIKINRTTVCLTLTKNPIAIGLDV